jgi:VanZ family protein
MTRNAFRAAFAFLLVLIVYLSVVPPALRPVTPLPHDVEHLAIFAIAGALLGLAFPGRPLARALPFLPFIVAIEFAQLWVPGRHARLSDLAINVAGACVGLGLSFLAWKSAPITEPEVRPDGTI